MIAYLIQLEGHGLTYQNINTENLPSQRCEIKRCNADFPALGTASDFGTESATDDLMAETDTQDTDARLSFQNLLGEIY